MKKREILGIKFFILAIVIYASADFVVADVAYYGTCSCNVGYSCSVYYNGCDPGASAVCVDDYGYCYGYCDCVGSGSGTGYCGDNTQQQPNGDNIYEECDNGASNTNDPDVYCSNLGNYYNDYCYYCTEGCMSTPVRGPYCGDGTIDAVGYEECDNSTDNGVPCILQGYGDMCIYCDDICEKVTLSAERCGDGIPNGIEECDNGASNTDTPCTPPALGGRCDYCNTSCIARYMLRTYCGDNICQTTEGEDNTTCFKDCFTDGWGTDDDNWRVSNDMLTTNGTGAIYTDPFDLKVNTAYNLSVHLISGCRVSFSLNNLCDSASTFTNTDCSIYVGRTYGVISPPGIDISFIINIPNNTHAISNEYFHNTRIKINSTCTSPSVAVITDISFREMPASGIVYNMPVSANLDTTGCCPADYCWNGEYCMNSSLWMNNASYPPLWNDVITRNWSNMHVNTTNQSQTTGYRCVINNVIGTADWTPSHIKYDWNYNQSGYCANDEYCFVGNNMIYGQLDDKSRSIGCLPHDSSVNDANDPYGLGKGNHYCYHGNWTTKSYIIAALLQNISVGERKPYVLHCYDDIYATNNDMLPISTLAGSESEPKVKILSACVLSHFSDENVLMGVVLDDPDRSMTEFITAIFIDYNALYYPSEVGESPLIPPETCEPLSNPDFSLCININENVGRRTLKVYYNEVYKYFIVSNYRVTVIEGTSVWENIWSRIKSAFAWMIRAKTTTITPYTSINYTTNYDRIYILRNGSANVTAIEESKYDEVTGNVTTILYVYYNGTVLGNNPINELIINDTLKSIYGEDRTLYVNTSNNAASRTQTLIIMTDNKTGLWQYFTSVLRLS